MSRENIKHYKSYMTAAFCALALAATAAPRETREDTEADKTFSDLVAKLQGRNQSARAQAANKISRVGIARPEHAHQLLDILVPLMKEPDSFEMVEAASRLVESLPVEDMPKIYSAMVPQLKNEEGVYRARVATTMAVIAMRCSNYVTSYLKDVGPMVRDSSLNVRNDVLSFMPFVALANPERRDDIAAVLAPLENDPDERVKSMAVPTLSRLRAGQLPIADKSAHEICPNPLKL